jgi:hypothetical protein
MSTNFDIEHDAVMPSPRQILAGQNIPAERLSDERTADLAEKARTIYARLVRPVGMITDVARNEFGDLYDGEGLNEPDAVLGGIFPTADHLSLFALTVGEPVCREITLLFERNDFAIAAMLDAAASAGAELAVEVITNRHRDLLQSDGRLDSSSAVLPFSPGYCGWHVSGQKKLFGRLKPEAIGIELSDSCLMQPLKSVSGVLVAAAIPNFDIDDTFAFCGLCTTRSCQDRYDQVRKIRKTI